MDELEHLSPEQIKVLAQLEMIRQTLTHSLARVEAAYNTIAVPTAALTPQQVIEQLEQVGYQMGHCTVGVLPRWCCELVVSLMQEGSKQ